MTGVVLCARPVTVSPPQAALTIGLVALYVVGYRTVFPSVSGAFVATEPVLVALMLTSPPGWAPAAVAVAVTLGGFDEWPISHVLHGLFQRVGQAFHCLGPALVLASAGWPGPDAVTTETLLLALTAQFAFDGVAALLRGAVQGVTPRQMARPLLWTFSVDALLAPIGFCIVATAQTRPAAYLLLATPIVLVRLMKSDRESHRKEAEEIKTAYTEVREQVHFDPLTGLHNRRAWDEAVARTAVEISRPDRRSAVVLVADVDHLKPTNDTYGHEAGDLLLQEVAQVMRSLGPEDAVVARLGGDEFGVLFTVSQGYPMPDFMGLARRAMVEASGRLGHQVSASLGVAVCPPGGSVEEGIRRADQAAGLDKHRRRVARVS
ncbi:GGDEF domain-containing protein [Arsenicicoccus dermatophilus]|uniref:GGDEF domain-containing protein n=1 Tax=Arsenicicoccus dermatophilus TaxID=1076331 RepID=UPI001F4C8340|nr:GGDEF domain-containing protein [Arsenicicoccus dermatophilus]MCH8613950.1 GGDEF domain-containing protein [Arsenicicoccus dermatophilus]